MGLSLNIQSNLVSPNNWVRPPQWLPMPTPGAEEMDCLLAVTNDDSNYVAFTITGGAYYVDWGDGNGQIPYGSGATAYGPQQNVTFTNDSASISWPGATELAAGQIVRFLTTGTLPTGFATKTNYFVSATGLTATTFQLAATNGGTPIVAGSAGSGTQTALVTYDFATFDPTNATLTTYGYKQAIVEVTPQSGQHITGISFQVKHPILATSGAYSTAWLDIQINCGNCTSLNVGGATLACGWVQRVNILSIGSITNFSSMFWDCYSLQSVPLFNTAAGTNFYYMFYNCFSLQSVPLFNTAAVTDFSGMFDNCYSLQSVPLFNTAAGTNFSGMFYNCYSLQSVPLFNTAAGTTFTNMFYNCSALQSVPLFNTAAGTNFATMFYGCSALQSVPLFNTAAGTTFNYMFYNCYALAEGALSGTTYAISYSGCKLSEAALVAIFTALGSANGGSQTITVTGTWGDALLTAADKAIATGKSWTVAT